MRLLGWLVIGALLAPVAFAGWVSFSPDSFLTPPTERWSVRWYVAFFHDHRWIAALGRSLVIAVLAAIVSLVAGGPLAFAVARYRFRGRTLLAVSVILPACVPPAVLGMGLLPLLAFADLWGNPLGLILVHGLLGLPVVYLVARNHLEQTSRDLEDAARGLGATRWQVTRRVTLPLLQPALFAGALAAFVISLNEGMVTIFLTTPDSETLPAVVWPQLRYAASPLVAVASGASTLAALGGILTLLRLFRRGLAPKSFS